MSHWIRYAGVGIVAAYVSMGCSGEGADGSNPGAATSAPDDGASAPSGSNAPAPANPSSPPSEPPVASVKAGVTTFTVPQAVADRASVFRLADGSVVVRLFTTPPGATEPFPWTAAEVTTAKAAAQAAAKLGAGNVVILPTSRLPRAALPRSFAADLPAGACSLYGTPRCQVDPTTQTMHVPPGELPTFGGQQRLFMGPNVTGGLLEITSVVVAPGADPTIDLIGRSANLGDVFERMTATTTTLAGADADGFTDLLEPFSYDFSGKTLYRQGPITLTLKKGKILANPKVKTGLKLDGLDLREAQLDLKGDIDVEAELDLAVTGSLATSVTRNVEATLFEAESPLPTMMIGPVPVPQTIKLALVASCRFEATAVARVTAGASLHQSVTVGGRYAAGAFHSDFALPPPVLTAVGPTYTGTATTNASCSVTARFTVLFYGVIGPCVGLSAGASFDAAYTPPSSVEWTLNGDVGAKLSVDSELKIPGLGPVGTLLSSKLPKGETQLFSKQYVLAQGGTP